MDMPTPRPSTTRNPQISQIGVVWSIVASRPSPVVISTAPVTRNGFHRPYRLISWPDPVEATSSPAISGRVSSPASVGSNERAVWKYWPRNTDPPNMTTPTTRLASTASTTVRSRNSDIGTIGSGARSSTTTAATSAATPEPGQRERDRGAPGELLAGQRDPDQQRRHAAGDQGRAQVVQPQPLRARRGR